ncbi:hypothetical protein HUT18_08015 [Streptomyces sp. NA04227]|uniref:hypothetical protein n=1 Tax=Streptomyces sp. NA04227 TaxID=2742136 RepID=UPI00158FEB28|nr:hypothetical protein [Streptomyces sp. NA04227]QKW06352.1 hypothetical protein HUT18_08015 [Streptomyces sp. NA04227]
MGLFDKLTGTRRPEDGVAPAPAEDVRTALLALNGPDVPYVIRDGAAENVDLVAEWRTAEPAWQTLFLESRLSHALRIRMRLAAEGHEVRALEEHWEVNHVGNPPRLAISSKYERGPGRTVTVQWTIQREDSGGLGVTETFRFDSGELRHLLREAALASGWTWRGVVFGKP